MYSFFDTLNKEKERFIQIMCFIISDVLFNIMSVKIKLLL